MSFSGASICAVVRGDDQYRQFFNMFGLLLKFVTLIMFVASFHAGEQQAAEEAAQQAVARVADRGNDENNNTRPVRPNYPERGTRTIFRRRLYNVHPITN